MNMWGQQEHELDVLGQQEQQTNESGQQKDAPHAKYVARNVMAAHAACACAYAGGAVSRERRSCMRY